MKAKVKFPPAEHKNAWLELALVKAGNAAQTLLNTAYSYKIWYHSVDLLAFGI